MSDVSHQYVALKGGWDQSTPTLELPAGFVRDALNFECGVTGGYSRISGYERFNGMANPSDAIYATIFVNSFTYTPVSGDIVTDASTAGYGTVIATGAAGVNQYVVVTMKNGVFGIGNILMVGVNVVGTIITPTTAMTASNHMSYMGLAADVYRALISAPPGVGAALGYVLYNDVVYVWRANAGATEVDCYKSSLAGWVNVPYYKEVRFSAASVAPAEGVSLVQGVVSAVVKRVVLQSGAYLGGTAAGKIIIAAPTGGDFSAGAFTSGMTGTCYGIQTAITFALGGKFEFDTGNFYGGAATNRVYGCDGINRAFEFDGDVLVPIDTGAAVDTPKHIAIHKNLLMLAQGASLMYSAPGLPYNFQGVAFAGEIGTGEIITGIKVLPGSSATAALLVTSRGTTYMLYGTSYLDFNFVSYNTGSGALDYSVQNMADTYMMDDRGVVSLKTTLNYGNFDTSTLTIKINKFIEQHRARVSYSTLSRHKSQYRIFFNDGFGLYITIVNGELIGVMPVYFPTPVYMCDEGKYSNGEEASFFCGTDGFLYRMEKGTSFDGGSIDAFFTLKFDPMGSARIRKRFRKAALEVSGTGYCAINFGYSLGYASTDISQPNNATYGNNIQLMQWDNFTWDAFVWDGQTIIPNECEMVGTGENVAITIRSGTPYFQPYTVNSAIVHYSKRRAMR